MEQVSSVLFHSQATQSGFARHLRKENHGTFSVSVFTFLSSHPNLTLQAPQPHQLPDRCISLVVQLTLRAPGEVSTGTQGMTFVRLEELYFMS